MGKWEMLVRDIVIVTDMITIIIYFTFARSVIWKKRRLKVVKAWWNNMKSKGYIKQKWIETWSRRRIVQEGKVLYLATTLGL